VAPGLIFTPAAKNNMPQAVLDIFGEFKALPYHGEADDIGYTVLFLASDESKFITGSDDPSGRRSSYSQPKHL
jgi:NAD(P)-dependent dehydrogenase (short-subunit alcohol dehydrogenase family)